VRPRRHGDRGRPTPAVSSRDSRFAACIPGRDPARQFVVPKGGRRRCGQDCEAVDQSFMLSGSLGRNLRHAAFPGPLRVLRFQQQLLDRVRRNADLRMPPSWIVSATLSANQSRRSSSNRSRWPPTRGAISVKPRSRACDIQGRKAPSVSSETMTSSRVRPSVVERRCRYIRRKTADGPDRRSRLLRRRQPNPRMQQGKSNVSRPDRRPLRTPDHFLNLPCRQPRRQASIGDRRGWAATGGT
jgi:hypothetical protein